MSDASWQDRSTLHRLYWDEGLTQSEIADRLGCSSSTITHWMDALDVETRSRGADPGFDADQTTINDLDPWWAYTAVDGEALGYRCRT